MENRYNAQKNNNHEKEMITNRINQLKKYEKQELAQSQKEIRAKYERVIKDLNSRIISI